MLNKLFSRLLAKSQPQAEVVNQHKETSVEEIQKDRVSKQPNVDTSAEAKLSAIKAKARELVIEAKDEALKVKSEAQEEARKIKAEAMELEKRVAIQKAEVNARLKELEEKSNTLKKAKDQVDRMTDESEKLLRKRKEELERIAALTREEAREQILSVFDKELVQEKGKRIREMEEEINRDIEVKAQQLLVETMRYGATDYVVEYTSSKVMLPDEELKGRIIGKEGRNIKKLEEMTGVEFDMDSTSGEIMISSFDPIRREIAKVSLERLIKDGRIQPAKIEDTVHATEKEIDRIIQKAGEDLCHRVGVYNIPKEVVSMLGKFKYRFSYGQNLIDHTLEVTKLGIAMAHELGVDVETVKLGCLFHDIGKIITEEDGTHVDLGVNFLRKYGIDEKIIDCVAEHHEDKPFSSIESAVVGLVDHVSGARPGARGEDFETYVKRMKALESAATEFDGVDKAYAISAGREVRVFVEPTKVDDASTAYLAREIAKKIELEQNYPGVVKVTVIRETRVTETAK